MSQISRRSMVAAMTVGSGLAAATRLIDTAHAQGSNGRVVNMDAYSYMLQDPMLTNWVQLINAGGLVQATMSAIFTVFPAADSAFAQFPGTVQSLIGYQNTTGTHNAAAAFPDNSRIVKLVRTHVIAGKHSIADLVGKKTILTTLAGTDLDIDATDRNAVKLRWISAANGQPLDATLAEPPVTTINAIIYVINSINKI